MMAGVYVHRAKSQPTKFLLAALVALVAALAVIFAGSHTASALSSTGPDSADFGNNAYYALSDDAQLRVTESIVPVYYPSDPGTIRVTADSFSFQNNPGSHPTVSFNRSPGVRSDTKFDLSGFTYDTNVGYWVALIHADLKETTETYPYISYRLSVPGQGLLSTYAANGSNSAIANQNRCDDNDEDGCDVYYNYSIPFGTACQTSGNTSASAKIYDGDNGNVGVQPKPFGVSVFDATDNRTISHARTGDEGDVQTATYTFTVQPYHKYRFKVSNVYSNNVMQIGLPYDGITYLSDCRSLEKTDRIYGSWGEYGIAATGIIKGVGSGAAFAGRGLPYATACSYTFLTIANAASGDCQKTRPEEYGNYVTGRAIPDVAASYPASSASSTLSGEVGISSLGGTYRTSGDITLTGGTIPKARSIVINAYNSAANSYNDVTIAGDIKYTTDPLSRAGEIPQVVVLARNINIKESVIQVDAWLSAEGTLNTCSDVKRVDITSTKCAKRLIINGPVMANQINLWRTAGSEDDALGDPAEVFNHRPDAYLWGIAQSAKSGRLETTYERELPPRY